MASGKSEVNYYDVATYFKNPYSQKKIALVVEKEEISQLSRIFDEFEFSPLTKDALVKLMNNPAALEAHMKQILSVYLPILISGNEILKEVEEAIGSANYNEMKTKEKDIPLKLVDGLIRGYSQWMRNQALTFHLSAADLNLSSFVSSIDSLTKRVNLQGEFKDVKQNAFSLKVVKLCEAISVNIEKLKDVQRDARNSLPKHSEKWNIYNKSIEELNSIQDNLRAVVRHSESDPKEAWRQFDDAVNKCNKIKAKAPQEYTLLEQIINGLMRVIGMQSEEDKMHQQDIKKHKLIAPLLTVPRNAEVNKTAKENMQENKDVSVEKPTRLGH